VWIETERERRTARGRERKREKAKKRKTSFIVFIKKDLFYSKENEFDNKSFIFFKKKTSFIMGT